MRHHAYDSDPPRSRLALITWLALAVCVTAASLVLSHYTSDWSGVLALNTLITPTWVMREVGRLLVNNLKFSANVSRSYDSQYKRMGAKVGNTVNARLPFRPRVSKSQAINIQSVADQIVPITLTDQANTAVDFSTMEETTQVDDYRSRYIQPGVESLVNTMDADGLNRMYKATFWTVGTPGTVPGSTGTNPQAAYLTYLQAGVKLSNSAVPPDGRIAVLNPNMHAYLAAGGLTIFNPQAQMSKVYRSGQFSGHALGFSAWYEDQNVFPHVIGTATGTPLINGASQTGSSIITDGWTASVTILLQGDVIQFAGVNAVNPMSYQSTGQLQDFVVTADVTSDGSGNATIPVYPALTTSGQLQTVTGSPANNAAITVFGTAQAGLAAQAGITTPQALMYHPDAYALVMADLVLPKGLWMSERISSEELAVSVRFLKQYDIMTDLSAARVDVLYGWKAVRPEMGARLAA
jgi:hypothetical protein